MSRRAASPPNILVPIGSTAEGSMAMTYPGLDDQEMAVLQSALKKVTVGTFG